MARHPIAEFNDPGPVFIVHVPNIASGAQDLASAIVPSAEQNLVACQLATNCPVNPQALTYLNRASDLI